MRRKKSGWNVKIFFFHFGKAIFHFSFVPNKEYYINIFTFIQTHFLSHSHTFFLFHCHLRSRKNGKASFDSMHSIWIALGLTPTHFHSSCAHFWITISCPLCFVLALFPSNCNHHFQSEQRFVQHTKMNHCRFLLFYADPL